MQPPQQKQTSSFTSNYLVLPPTRIKFVVSWVTKLFCHQLRRPIRLASVQTKQSRLVQFRSFVKKMPCAHVLNRTVETMAYSRCTILLLALSLPRPQFEGHHRATPPPPSKQKTATSDRTAPLVQWRHHNIKLCLMALYFQCITVPTCTIASSPIITIKIWLFCLFPVLTIHRLHHLQWML